MPSHTCQIQIHRADTLKRGEKDPGGLSQPMGVVTAAVGVTVGFTHKFISGNFGSINLRMNQQFYFSSSSVHSDGHPPK